MPVKKKKVDQGERCERCKFFAVHGDEDKVGKCRIRPPSVDYKNPHFGLGLFPSVHREGWCGAFKMNVEAASE